MPPPVGEWAAFSGSPRQESGKALDRGEILLQGRVTAAQLRLALAHGSATLEDCVIDAGNYKVLPGKRLLICGSVVFMGPSTISLSSHSEVRGAAEDTPVSGVKLIVPNDTVGAIIKNLLGSEPWLTYNPFIVFLASAESVPYRCAVSKCGVTRMDSLYRIYGAHKCTFEDNYSNSSFRGFVVHSADSCRFVREIARTLPNASPPIVGFINIPWRSTASRRGIVNNVYEDIEVHGWTEEGFSFDSRHKDPVNSSLVLNSHISAVSVSGIVLAATINEDLAGYVIMLNTGVLAGRWYEIASNIGSSLTLNGFSEDWADAAIGDFAGVELACHGNVVRNLQVESSGDPTGVCVWMWGAGIKFHNTNLTNSRIEIASGAMNSPNTETEWSYYGAPHGVSFVDTQWNGSECGNGFQIYQHTDYHSELLGDSSISPEDMLTRGVVLSRGRPRRVYLGKCATLAIDYLDSADILENNLSTGNPSIRTTGRLRVTPTQAACLRGEVRQEILVTDVQALYGIAKKEWTGWSWKPLQ